MNNLVLEALHGALVGGVIGYATNQLAVWMLFHPRQPIRFLGVELPLTPGLVVKNKTRLAEAVGRSVARDLLDEAALRQQLRQIDLRSAVEELLRTEWARLREERRSLGEMLGPEGSRAVAAALRAEAPRLLAPTLRRPLRELVPVSAMDAARDLVQRELTTALEGEVALGVLHAAVAEALPKLPEGESWSLLDRGAREYLSGRLPVLAAGMQESLADYLASPEFGEQVQPKLAGRLHSIIVDKFPMAKMFVTEKTLQGLVTSRWEEISAELQEIARGESMGALLCTKLESGAANVFESIREALQDDNLSGQVATSLAREVRSIAGGLLSSERGAALLQGGIDRLAARSITELLGSEADLLAAQLCGELEASAVLARPLCELLDCIPADELLPTVAQAIASRAEDVLPAFAHSHLRIEEIVSRQIETFEADRLEETIHRVSGKELRGIVLFGGILGTIVGAISQVISALL